MSEAQEIDIILESDFLTGVFRLDILSGGSPDGFVRVHTNTGGAPPVFVTTVLHPDPMISPGLEIESLFPADLDGDGDVDIVAVAMLPNAVGTTPVSPGLLCKCL